MSKKRNSDGAEPDMTPMIDVVFQLIIFFIVTINLSDAKDDTVRLELGVHGHPVESGADSNVSALLIDVARNGRCSIANQTLKLSSLRDIVRRRLIPGACARHIGRVSKFDTVLIGLFRSTSFFYYKAFRGFSQANIHV